MSAISIVTPSFNQAQFLERTKQSVLSQGDVDVEYVICDGRSCDGSTEIIKRYRTKLATAIIEFDNGQAEALCKGFRHTTGDILGYLNSDDMLLPGTLKYVTTFFYDNPDIDAIYSHRLFIDENDRLTKLWILPKHSDYCMSRWDYIPQETCFWRRRLMDQTNGINPSYQFAMDYDLFVRMMKKGRFKRVNKFLSAFREHSSSKTIRLYDSLGKQEVSRVQSENGIKFQWYDKIIGHIFG